MKQTIFFKCKAVASVAWKKGQPFLFVSQYTSIDEMIYMRLG